MKFILFFIFLGTFCAGKQLAVDTTTQLYVEFPVSNLPNHRTVCQMHLHEPSGQYTITAIGMVMAGEDQYASHAGLLRLDPGNAGNNYTHSVHPIIDFGAQDGFAEKQHWDIFNANLLYLLINNITYPPLDLDQYTGVITVEFPNGDITSTPIVTKFASPLGAAVMASITQDDDGVVYFSDSGRAVIYSVNRDGSDLKIWNSDERLNAGYMTSVNGIRYSNRLNGINGVVLGSGINFFISINKDGSSGPLEVMFQDNQLAGAVEYELSPKEKSGFAGLLFDGRLIRYDLTNKNYVEATILNTTNILPGSVSQLKPLAGHPNPEFEGCLQVFELGFAHPDLKGAIKVVCPEITTSSDPITLY